MPMRRCVSDPGYYDCPKPAFVDDDTSSDHLAPHLYKPTVMHPSHKVTQREWVDAVAEGYLLNLPKQSRMTGRKYDLAYFRRMAEVNMGIDERYFVLPASEIVKNKLTPQEQADIFLKEGMQLARAAVQECLLESGVASEDIGKIFFTSHNPLLFPSLPAHLMSDPDLEFRKDCRVWTSHNYGCSGGGVVLEEAREWLELHPNDSAMLVCLEISSVGFRPCQSGMSWFINATLFGDAVAVAVLDGATRFAKRSRKLRHSQKTARLVGGGARLFPGTADAMHYSYVEDQGYHFHVTPSVGPAVKANAPGFVNELVRDAFPKKRAADLECVILHPGGRKIVEACYEPLGLKGSDSERAAYDTLRHGGNRASVTVLDMLKRRWGGAMAGDEGVILGIGPGVYMAGVCLRFCTTGSKVDVPSLVNAFSDPTATPLPMWSLTRSRETELITSTTELATSESSLRAPDRLCCLRAPRRC